LFVNCNVYGFSQNICIDNYSEIYTNLTVDIRDCDDWIIIRHHFLENKDKFKDAKYYVIDLNDAKNVTAIIGHNYAGNLLTLLNLSLYTPFGNF